MKLRKLILVRDYIKNEKRKPNCDGNSQNQDYNNKITSKSLKATFEKKSFLKINVNDNFGNLIHDYQLQFQPNIRHRKQSKRVKLHCKLCGAIIGAN